MAEATLTTALMTAVSAARPTTNYEYGAKHPLRLGGSGDCLTYIYFSKPFPAGATIASAVLIVNTEAVTVTGTHTLTVRRLKQAVSMTKVTYNTRPTALYADTAATVSKTGTQPVNTEWQIDVTAMLQSVANGDAWYGLQLTSNFNPVRYVYGPKWTTAAYRPRLVVSWTVPPEAPTALAPGGGRAIGGAKPYLRASYADPNGDNPIANVQVQRATTSDFTTPAWDSGTVAASAAELDTATTSWVALADNEVVFWRIRVQDVNGLWSAWSQPDSFKRDIKGTLTITSPGASPNNIVNDDTAPIAWTFTGETQAAYQVTIIEPETQKNLWTSGKITGTATGVTLPPGVLTETGKVYHAGVIVWDAKQRETLPNDPAYVGVAQPFTFALSSVAAPVTTLTASQDFVRPKVTLDFVRSAFPDSFTVLRNSKVIASDIIPGDVLVSGTAFRWVDPAPEPGLSAVYEVAAVVNGKASSGNATATITPQSQGIWLADRLRTNEVVIYGRDARSFTLGENSEIFEVLGGTEVAVVTHAQRGLEGQVTGQIHGGLQGLGLTAQEWRTKLLKIRDAPGQQCWLTLNDATIPVFIANVTCTPRALPTLSYDVSFNFYQCSPR